MIKTVFRSALCFVLLNSSMKAPAIAQVNPDHVARMQMVTSATASPDGRYIAYGKTDPADPRTENRPAAVHLYLLDKQTGSQLPFFTRSSVAQIQFRPGNNTVTFLSRDKGDKTNALYEMALQGGEAHKIFSLPTGISNYAWSPDGRQLAYVTAERADTPDTYLSYSPAFYEEEFPDRNAYITTLTQADDKGKKINVKGSVYQLEWSPEGNRLAISVAPTSSVDDSYMAQAVKVIDAGSGSILSEIQNEGKLGQIEWSPDGSMLALIGGYDLHDPTDGSLLIVPASGGKPGVIHGDYKGKFVSIHWKESGRIHFLSNESTSSAIGTIRPDGSNLKYLLRRDDQHITSFDLSGKSEISFTANSPLHPSELFTLGTSRNADPVRRTFSNPWMENLQMGKQEVVTYKTRDGKYDIQGMLIYPLNYRAGTPVPLITVVHGGPEAHYSNGWLTAYSMPGQMAAAEGYAVFYPNYRGSTGRGVEFTYSSQGDLAGKEFDDIVDGVDYLIAQGIADKNRIGVTGGSYGGYASAWMSTYYSDRFAAAVMFVGISNNISKYGTSDIPQEMFLVHSRKRIWDDWQWQLERSPIYYVDRAQTPILIMHGAEDPRVHPAQSMELYRHLKVRKPEVPVRLIYYPGEGHGNARSGSRYDYNLRMMQWFNTYLKSGNSKAEIPGLDLPKP